MAGSETGGDGGTRPPAGGAAESVLFLASGECDEVRFVSQQYEALWGQSTAELLADAGSLLDGVHPADREAVVGGVARLRAGGEVVEVDCRVNADTGYARTVRLRAEPVHDADGTVDEIVATAREVSDEVACCAERERYRTVLRNIPDGVYLFDADGVLQFVNRAALDASGETAAAMLDRSIEELLRGSTADPGEAEQAIGLHERLADGDIEEGRMTLQFGDGADRRPFALRSARGYADDGEFVGLVSVVRDVSDRVAAEEELTRQNERLDEFASILSHDLRNPLNVASARLALAREECDSAHLDEVAWAHDRMAELIADVLTAARVGGSASDLEAVGLPAVVGQCWTGVETADATLVVDTDRVIRANRSRLRQLFENLVRNAVEHGGDGVTVTVGELPDGFFVADDGPGIPLAERAQVFDTGYTTAAEGTGFGLHIVAQVATAHGWGLRVAAGDDGGARFEFTGVEFVGE